MNKTIAIATLLAAGWAAAADAPRTISVSGEGKVKVKADKAQMTCTFEDKCGPNEQVAVAVDASKKRAVPAVDYLKSVVGKDGKVCTTTSIQRVDEYSQDPKTGQGSYKFVGHKVITTVSVTLEGEGAVETKLAKLYDTSSVKADSIGTPTTGLSEERQRTAELAATKIAIKDAKERAEAQLEDGEQLGSALTRSTSRGYARPMYEARAMAAPGGRAPQQPDGQALVDVDNTLTVTTDVQCVFGVDCPPTRVTAQQQQAQRNPLVPPANLPQ
jgi:uncharacterized protein YggE